MFTRIFFRNNEFFSSYPTFVVVLFFVPPPPFFFSTTFFSSLISTWKRQEEVWKKVCPWMQKGLNEKEGALTLSVGFGVARLPMNRP
jgi:hypothetical protein